MGVGRSVEAPSWRGNADGRGPAGCWGRLPSLRACMPSSRSKSKVDAATLPAAPTARVDGGMPMLQLGRLMECAIAETKLKNDGLQVQPVQLVVSCSTTTSSAESTSPNSTVVEELKVSFQLRKFTYSELKCATRNFRPEALLGEGGFGRVYKGWIEENGTAPVRPGTGLTVAVKTLNHDGLQGHKEWMAEVNFLGNLQHPNLVKLIGYCIEDNQRQLVYEFMSRGSLEHHLFRRTAPLPWSIRLKIALGAAKGLAFLHEETERPVIFRDLKTSNVLLDAEFNAKLSDFGLARDGPEGDKTHVSTRVMGTYGYAAPEYVMTGHLTSKSDVYSFGVVLLELMTGRKSMDKNRPNGDRNLVEWARPYLKDRLKLYRMIDPKLGGNYSLKGAHRLAQMAHACLTRNPKARPLMSKVVEALEPLPNLKDMAATSNLFQAQAERAGSSRLASPNGSHSMKAQSSSAQNGQQAVRSLSYGPPFRSAFHASPFCAAPHAPPYRQSPRPSAK